jgi:hypothetical protein
MARDHAGQIRAKGIRSSNCCKHRYAIMKKVKRITSITCPIPRLPRNSNQSEEQQSITVTQSKQHMLQNLAQLCEHVLTGGSKISFML